MNLKTSWSNSRRTRKRYNRKILKYKEWQVEKKLVLKEEKIYILKDEKLQTEII